MKKKNTCFTLLETMLSKDECDALIAKYSEKIAYGYYIGSNTISSHNADRKFPAASIVKVFLLFYALSKRTEFTRNIPLDEISPGGDSVLNFIGNRNIPFELAMALMIDMSDNYAANYVIDHSGMERINSFLKESGFNSTLFQRRFLDYEARSRGIENLTTVEDLHMLINKIYSERAFKESELGLFDAILRNQFDKSKCQLYLREELGLRGKSGSLDNVWNDMVF